LAAQGSAQIQSKKGRKAKKRDKGGSGDMTASGESKGGKKSRKGSSQKARQEAKRQRQAERQGYSFKGGSDIVGIVMMEITGARDLPRWKNSLRTTFDMDPFTIVAFGQKVFRTRVLRHTLNPVWNEKLLYHVRKGEDNFDIKMSIYDWDKISSNDHVGSCVLPLSTLLQAAPKPDATTGLFDQDANAVAELKTFDLPLTRQGRDEEVKFGHSSPMLTIKAKYMPYAALRQRFWRQLLNQFDTNDSRSLSALELTAMLDSLGSTLTTETIQSFFTSRNKSYENDELSIDEVIVALEAEINKPAIEKRHRDREVKNSHGPPGSPALLSTGADRGEGGTPAEQALDVSGPSAPIPDANDVEQHSSAPVPIPASSRVPTTKDRDMVSDTAADDDRPGFFSGSPEEDKILKRPTHLSPLSVPRPGLLTKRSSSSTSPSRSPSRQSSTDALRSSPSPLRSGSTPEPQQGLDVKEVGDDDRPIERVVLLKTCPLCHMPRLSRKGDGDVITHLAVCASQDWRRVDSMVVRNFVTSNQAHRKFFNKILINATQGAYRLGANSANLIVQDRQTGELLEEKMQVYVRLGIRLLYQGARSRMEGARVKRMLKNMSIKQGKKYDSLASAKEIPGFIAFHNLNVDEIRDPLDSFKTFNEFFYRKLKPDARPVDEPQNRKRLVSSADCRMMAFDSIDAATRLWIKGREFSVERLLGDEFKGKVEDFKNGSLCIFRLAPQDYHRFHCPADAVVGEPVWIDGQ
jgi:phosphatidylserine decarboxylase